MKEINFQEFEKLKKENKKILLDVKASWCGPCKALIPKLEEIESKYPDVEFVMLDVDQNREECVNMGIRGVPTVMIYKGEELIDRTSGVQPETHYTSKLDTL